MDLKKGVFPLFFYLLICGSLHVEAQTTTETCSQGQLQCDQHVIITKSVDGASFEIEDKSQWKVAEQDREKVKQWKDEDLVQLYPNVQWFRETDFIVLNKNAKQYACADLFLGPMVGNKHYKWIKDIDYYYGEILVENQDGSQALWRVTPSDVQLLSSWKINHPIIIGSNTPGWLWTDSNDCILINVERNRYVQVQEIK